jgi:hypothetical protein
MRKLLMLTGTTCLLLGACKGARNDTDEQLLASCFAAIKANDWKAYSRLTLTPADILEQVSGSRPRSPFKGRQGYVGSVLRPEQMKVHEEAFRRAVRGGKGQIDFARSKVVGPGTLLGTQNPWQRMGASFPYRTYSLRVETGGRTVDTKELRPLFTVVTWEDKQRLIDLVF